MIDITQPMSLTSILILNIGLIICFEIIISLIKKLLK